MDADGDVPLDALPEGASSAPSTTQRVLFGRLQAEDAASATVRRIRTAIGLGLLSDGDRLPRESDLAEQLGITAFSLREALGALRAEGLIVTRRGKNGGSFVRAPADSESIAVQDLVSIAATELRDLGDWRLMMTAQEAWFATTRSSPATSTRLFEFEHRLRSAETPQQARRALGRFHAELAAGAQSIRLSRAEFSMHEEFDWLATVLLRDRDQRDRVADGMRELAEAVSAGQPEVARDSGIRLVSGIVTELARIRLGLLASQRDGSRAPAAEETPDLIEAVRAFIDGTLRSLEAIASEIAPALGEDPASDAAGALIAKSLMSRLADPDPAFDGIGFIAARGAIRDHLFWMAWWQRGTDGSFERDHHHVLDPLREDFYDYSSMEFLVTPQHDREPSAMGPYVDHGGVDDYLITAAVPVVHEERFLGVVAVDIRVSDLERTFSPWLADDDRAIVLLNRENRVILSNTVAWNAGDVLRANGRIESIGIDRFGWRVAELGRAE